MLAHEAAIRWTGMDVLSLYFESEKCDVICWPDNFSILRADFLRRTGVDWANLQVYLGIRDLEEYESIE